jgi:hypothetical protein
MISSSSESLLVSLIKEGIKSNYNEKLKQKLDNKVIVTFVSDRSFLSAIVKMNSINLEEANEKEL